MTFLEPEEPPPRAPEAELVEVVRAADFSFDGRAATEQTIVLATGIDAATWVSAALEVLLHAKNAWDADALAMVEVYAVVLSATQPDVEYVGALLATQRITDVDLPETLFLQGAVASGFDAPRRAPVAPGRRAHRPADVFAHHPAGRKASVIKAPPSAPSRSRS